MMYSLSGAMVALLPCTHHSTGDQQRKGSFVVMVCRLSRLSRTRRYQLRFFTFCITAVCP